MGSSCGVSFRVANIGRATENHIVFRPALSGPVQSSPTQPSSAVRLLPEFQIGRTNNIRPILCIYILIVQNFCRMTNIRDPNVFSIPNADINFTLGNRPSPLRRGFYPAMKNSLEASKLKQLLTATAVQR